MKNKTVKTVEQIYKLAQRKKSLIIKHGFRNFRMPAAFVINQQGHYLVNLLRSGSISIYEK